MENLLGRAYNKLRYFLRQKAIVLSYHRVANIEIDPWQLAVSPDNFEQQLKVLKKFKLLSTSQVTEALKRGSLTNGMISITFDDGYRDNYLIAKPLLQKWQIPATIFIPSYYVDSGKQFWWDELQSIILGVHDLPAVLSIKINKEEFKFDLEGHCKFDEVKWQKLKSWIWYEPPPTKRGELYLELWKRIKPLDHSSINMVLTELKNWACVIIEATDLELPVTQAELEELIRDPLFEIGIHTVTHPALASHNKQKQFQEISGCKKFLVESGNTDLPIIAYPYGIYNDDTIDLGMQLGLKGGFTTENSPVLNVCHPLKMGRMHVKNWSGSEFEKQLQYWIKGIKF